MVTVYPRASARSVPGFVTTPLQTVITGASAASASAMWPVRATGAGATSRFSISLVITAGMLLGTLFILFLLPAYCVPLRQAGAATEGAAAVQSS